MAPKRKGAKGKEAAEPTAEPTEEPTAELPVKKLAAELKAEKKEAMEAERKAAEAKAAAKNDVWWDKFRPHKGIASSSALGGPKTIIDVPPSPSTEAALESKLFAEGSDTFNIDGESLTDAEQKALEVAGPSSTLSSMSSQVALQGAARIARRVVLKSAPEVPAERAAPRTVAPPATAASSGKAEAAEPIADVPPCARPEAAALETLKKEIPHEIAERTSFPHGGSEVMPAPLTCVKCNEPVDPLRCYVQNKQAQTYRCTKCNAKGVMLSRALGAWPPKAFGAMTKEKQQFFWASIKHMENWAQVEKTLVDTLVTERIDQEESRIGGSFWPLSKWEREGYDPARIEALCTLKEEHPILGTVYCVKIKSIFQATIERQVRTEIFAHKQKEPRMSASRSRTPQPQILDMARAGGVGSEDRGRSRSRTRSPSPGSRSRTRSWGRKRAKSRSRSRSRSRRESRGRRRGRSPTPFSPRRRHRRSSRSRERRPSRSRHDRRRRSSSRHSRGAKSRHSPERSHRSRGRSSDKPASSREPAPPASSRDGRSHGMALDPSSKEAQILEKYRQKAEAAKQKELAKAEAAKQKERAKAEAAAKAEASKAEAALAKENNKAVSSASKAQNKLSAMALQLATALKDKFAKHVPEFIVDPAVAASSELEKVSISANATCWPSHYAPLHFTRTSLPTKCGQNAAVRSGMASKLQKVMATCNEILVKKQGSFPWSDADVAKMVKDFGPIISDLEKMLKTAKEHMDDKKK